MWSVHMHICKHMHATSIALVYKHQGKLQEAFEMYSKSLAIKEKQSGPTSVGNAHLHSPTVQHLQAPPLAPMHGCLVFFSDALSVRSHSCMLPATLPAFFGLQDGAWSGSLDPCVVAVTRVNSSEPAGKATVNQTDTV